MKLNIDKFKTQQKKRLLDFMINYGASKPKNNKMFGSGYKKSLKLEKTMPLEDSLFECRYDNAHIGYQWHFIRLMITHINRLKVSAQVGFMGKYTNNISAQKLPSVLQQGYLFQYYR